MKIPYDDKYEISKEFCTGLSTALIPQPLDQSKSEHWQAGYAAGCEMRELRSEKMNAYLVSIGHEPWGTVRLA